VFANSSLKLAAAGIDIKACPVIAEPIGCVGISLYFCLVQIIACTM
jgi:hypothetical protein